MRLEFGLFVLAGFATGMLIYFASASAEYRQQIFQVSDCVNSKWIEHEDRTGEMPSKALEDAWVKQCAGGIDD